MTTTLTRQQSVTLDIMSNSFHVFIHLWLQLEKSVMQGLVTVEDQVAFYKVHGIVAGGP